MNKEEVPLAFPHKWERDDGSTVIAYGATLRDYFAAKAMLAMLAHPDSKTTASPQTYAAAAYTMADAMLEQRK